MNVRFYSLDGILPESEILEEDSPLRDCRYSIEDEEEDEEDGKAKDAPFLESDLGATSTPNAVDATL